MAPTTANTLGRPATSRPVNSPLHGHAPRLSGAANVNPDDVTDDTPHHLGDDATADGTTNQTPNDAPSGGVHEGTVAHAVGATIPVEAGPEGFSRPAVDPTVWELHVRYARDRDREALEQLVAEYDRYAVSLANRLHRHGEPLEDLEQIAREALLVALRRFDPVRGIPFAGFATPTILGAIRRHYRDHGWSVRVPRWVHDTTVAARRTAETLTASLGRKPTVEEVAGAMGVSVERILQAEEAAEARTPGSLDTASDDGAGTVHELVGRVDRRLVEAENHVALGQVMAELGERDRQLIGLYYFEELSQSEIAARFGVSQMQVSRWLASAISRMRGRLAA